MNSIVHSDELWEEEIRIRMNELLLNEEIHQRVIRKLLPTAKQFVWIATADISVIHGGQNTVMNACLSGTPIVGIGMHPEQQANLDACVRKGFAIRLNKRRATASDVLSAIDQLLHDEGAKSAVETFRTQLEKWDGPANAARFLEEQFGR